MPTRCPKDGSSCLKNKHSRFFLGALCLKGQFGLVQLIPLKHSGILSWSYWCKYSHLSPCMHKLFIQCLQTMVLNRHAPMRATVCSRNRSCSKFAAWSCWAKSFSKLNMFGDWNGAQCKKWSCTLLEVRCVVKLEAQESRSTPWRGTAPTTWIWGDYGVLPNRGGKQVVKRLEATEPYCIWVVQSKNPGFGSEGEVLKKIWKKFLSPKKNNFFQTIIRNNSHIGLT